MPMSPGAWSGRHPGWWPSPATPHDDSFTTGERAAQLLFRLLRDRERPVAAMAKVPVLTSGIHGMTFGDTPMAHLTRRARERWKQDPGILSVSVFGVHPYNDLPGLGSGGLVISDKRSQACPAPGPDAGRGVLG